jgi:hypothetical protein
MVKKQSKTTINDVLVAINGFANTVQSEFGKVHSELHDLKGRVSVLEQNMVTKDYLETRLAKQETKLVTKEYLDEKLYDLRGDLVNLTRKEDHKVISLVKLLRQRKVINDRDASSILELEPFAN